MLGTLDFTVSEHWAPFNFPQSTALVTCKPEPPVRWEHIILRPYNIRILEVRPCYSPKLVDSVTFILYRAITFIYTTQIQLYSFQMRY